MFNNIIFFNQMRNGDVHVSRNFVKYLMKQLPSNNYIYAHNNDYKLIKDIDGLIYSKINFNIPEHLPFIYRGDSLYINTWIGQRKAKYSTPIGCTYKSNIYMYNDLIDELNKLLPFKINKINFNDSSLIPKIDYTKYDIVNIDNFMKEKQLVKKVFISNGTVMSGQSENFNFNPIISAISKQFSDILFFVSNDCIIKDNNIIHNKDLIQTTNSDLNENSYISTFCNLIIGRISGSHTFSLVQDNLFNPNKTMISICHRQEEGLWYPESLARIIWSNNFNINNIIELIYKTIGEMKWEI